MKDDRSMTATWERGWWLCVVIILLLGLYLHLSGYNYGLNLFEHGVDEQRIYQDAYYQMHGLTDKITLPGYPPGIFAIDYAAYLVLHAQYQQPDRLYTMEGLHLVRLWSGLGNLFTALCLMLSGRLLRYPLGGLLAALIFLSSLGVVQQTIVSLSEGFQITAIWLTIYLVLLGLEYQRPRYLVLATLTALAAMLIKYPSALTLGIPLAVTLWLMWQVSWRRWGRVFVLQVSIIVLVGAWLLLGYDATRLTSIGGESALFDSNLQNLQNDPLALATQLPVLNILSVATQQLHVTPLSLGIIFMLGVAAYWKRATQWQRAVFMGLGLFYLLWCALIPLYLDIGFLKARYATPVSGVGAFIIGVGLTASVGWLVERLGYRKIGYAALLIGVGVWLLPPYNVLYLRAKELALPNAFDDYLHWAYTALPTDGTLLIRQTDWVFFTQNNTTELNIPTRTWYQGYLPQRSRAEWLKDAIIYAYVEDYEIEEFKQRENGAAELEQMLLLKEFPMPGNRANRRGPDINIYRLFPMQMMADVTFGGIIRWAGYDLSATPLKPGDTLTFSPYWQALQTPPTNYNIYVHLIPLTERTVLAQADGLPAGGPDYPTSQWSDPYEIILGSRFTLTLPDDILPGTYRLIMGIYDWQTGARLTTPTGKDYTEIAQIEVHEP